jgi:hypothetical protein
MVRRTTRRATRFPDRTYFTAKMLCIPKRHRLAAMGLFAAAFAYTGGGEEGGYIVHPTGVKALGGTPAVIAALIEAGLWTEVPDGYRVEGEGDLWTRSITA